MEKLRDHVASAIPRSFGSDEHVKSCNKIVNRYERDADRLIEKFESRAEKQGFALKRVRDGNVSRPELFPTVQGQAISMSDLVTLARDKKISETQTKAITKKFTVLRAELEGVAKETRKIIEKMEQEVEALERSHLQRALEEPARQVTGKHENEAITEHLGDVINHLTENVKALRQKSAQEDRNGGGTEQNENLENLLGQLEVNVILDNRGREQCPVLIENLPTYRRLFGYFEKAMDRSGVWTTDFRKIRGGSLLRADGGYLVLNADDLLRSRGVWQNLKRALVNRALEVYEEGTPMQPPVTNMTPEPIDINVKVILIGDRPTYTALYNTDPDFRKIFKVLADFDYEMDLNKKNLRQYAAFIGKMCHEEKLAGFDQGAVAAVAEFGARKAGRQGKLTARFGDISDLLREADYWRRKNGQSRVAARHVKAAVRAAEQRNNLWEEKIRELVTSGIVLVELKGQQVGQINGLQVQDSGAHSFGLPARITASAAPGSAGIINIEREAQLSGRTHNKGVLIIGGYFREMFGRHKPVTFTASLAFEQSYGSVDGDSASAAEIFAILSALSRVPLSQSMAVTGSVDQKGNVQPVGAVNLKIEGHFRVCHARGLGGSHGVIIPEANVPDLMLRDEVVEAVKKKRFHVYPIRTIEEGIEILTGMPAGEKDRDGYYPEGTVYGLVDKRLAEMAETVRKYPSPGRGI
jgi:ATP-dependent Lon protease